MSEKKRAANLTTPKKLKINAMVSITESNYSNTVIGNNNNVNYNVASSKEYHKRPSNEKEFIPAEKGTVPNE